MTANPYETGLDRNPANYQPLTPLSNLERAAHVYPDHLAVVHGALRMDYRTFYTRSKQLASSLAKRGVKKGDTISVMLSNTPAMLEAHHGVPMAGAVFHSFNTRLDAAVIAFQLDHAETKILIVDREFSAVMAQALELAEVSPLVIDYDDPNYGTDAPFPKGERIGTEDYEAFLQAGDPDYDWSGPDDEWDSISLNYTSGTTGNPKGVVYHHRGAALMGYSNVIASGMQKHPVYLWTLPMFHCNGWCFPWTLGVVAGTHVCLRWVRAGAMYDALADHGVTHLCGAPIVMSTLLNAPDNEKRSFDQTVSFNTAAARIALKARQGVRYNALEGLSIRDPETMEPVPDDGETIGEVMFRGNIVMKGYLKNLEASSEAFAGGWFHSGDLGVMHPDGYIQLKDRSKDIIISGGENISSIEVEDALYRHPGIQTAAVVARPDDKWGETPCAFIELKPGHTATREEIIDHCRALLAHFKCPRHVVFQEVPKTSTGKIQKFVLREQAKIL